MTHIAVQRVGSDVGDIQVDQAVVVVVTRARAHPVLSMADTRGCCHVLERAVPAVPEQTVSCALGDGWIGERAAVDEKDVEPAIVVKVEEQAARPEDLRQELLVAGAADMSEVQPRRTGDVSEHWKVRRSCGVDDKREEDCRCGPQRHCG